MSGLPRLVKPMLAVLQPDLPGDEDAFGWELKWDGVRALAYVDEGRVTLMSRNEKDMTGSYPELAVLGERVGEPMILDGEIVALLDESPDFGLLQSRMHVRRPSDRLVAATPVLYYVFDLLHRGDRSLLQERYTARREALEDLDLDTDPVHTPPWWRGDGAAVLSASRKQGLEGVVGKPLTSRYQPGHRESWIKIKNVRHQEVIVAGWTPGEGRRANMIGSLILGVYDDHGLRYVGNVGTGFTEAALRQLADQLRPLARETNPFDTTVPAPSRAPRAGPNRPSSVRSPTPSGRPTGICAIRPGAASAPKNLPKRSPPKNHHRDRAQGRDGWRRPLLPSAHVWP